MAKKEPAAPSKPAKKADAKPSKPGQTMAATATARVAIKLLKNWNGRKAGEVLSLVAKPQADVLIKRGLAEAVKKKTEK